MTFEEYIKNHKFENVEDLKEFLKSNSIYSTHENSFCVEKEMLYGLQDNKSLWFEYCCCEQTSRNGYIYDVPSWDLGVMEHKGILHIYFEEYACVDEDFNKGFYQFKKMMAHI